MVAGSKISPLLVIVGETASGKSALAIQAARKLNGEIICADAWTVRRGADIGTAKPTKEEQKLAAHHLIDIIGPDEPFNAASFKRLANDAIKDIASRGKLPILVGGTGLYIDGVLYDYSFLPSRENTSREELNELSNEDLVKRINDKGYDASGVDIKNNRRLIRLLETGGQKPQKKQIRSNTLVVGLAVDKDILKQRITNRADAMIKAGLENEVLGLSREYGWDSEALKGISYVEWHDYFLGSAKRDEVRENIIKNCLDLAKRQRTWFKRNKSIQWLATPVKWTDVVDLYTTVLSN
jgi:tRNA dimethylallyltransferase